MEMIAALAIIVGVVILILLPSEATVIRERASKQQISLTKARSLLIALSGITLSFAAGIVCFSLVMFGPAYILDDFIGTPWITSLPAVIVGRSEESRVGNECVSTCRSRWSPNN